MTSNAARAFSAAWLLAACASPLMARYPAARELEQKCSAGSGSACRELATFIARTDGGSEEESGTYLRKSCPQDSLSCMALADFINTEAVPRYEKAWALRTLLMGCEQGEPARCRRAADVYLEGHLVEMDLAVATRLHARACDLGDARSCDLLSEASRAGHLGLKQDVGKARRLRERAIALSEVSCSMSERDACLFLETLYSKTGSFPSNASALRLRRGLCRAGNQGACRTLTDDTDAGPDGLECAQGERWSCAALADSAVDGGLTPNSSPRAVELFRKSCELGAGWYCFELAHVIAASDPPEAARLRARTVSLYSTECEAGVTADCDFAIAAYGAGVDVARDPERVASLQRVLCNAGENSAACRSAGWAYRHGRNVPKNLARALPLLERACRGSDPSPKTCEELASIYQAIDEPKALEFRQLARGAWVSFRALTRNLADAGTLGNFGVLGGSLCPESAPDNSCVGRETSLDRYLTFGLEDITVCAAQSRSGTDPVATRVRISLPADGGPVSWEVLDGGVRAAWLHDCIQKTLGSWPPESWPTAASSDGGRNPEYEFGVK